MGDVLSQSEIDELLKAMSGGGGDSGGGAPAPIPVLNRADKAKPYDFARPSKFNKEQLRSLQNIFDNYSRSLSSFLTGYLRTSTFVEVSSAEQVTYAEFNSVLINPVLLGIVEFPPLKGSIILELSTNIGYAIIDRILGGPGFGISKIRDFTEIEKILLNRVMSQMLTFLAEPWETVAPVRPRLEKIETNSQFAQIIAPNEMAALVTLTIKIGSVDGMLNFCIPHLSIEKFMDRLNTKYWFATASDDDEDAAARHKEQLEERLRITKVPLTAVIGRTRVNVRDFVEMQPGDIIPLDSFVSSDLQVYVGNIFKFTAKPGVSKGHTAFQITSVIEREE